MPVSFRIETQTVRDTLDELQNLPDVLVRGPIADGAAEWFARDVLPRARRANYGFTDRTGTLRAAIRGGADLRPPGEFAREIEFSLGADVVYAAKVEYVTGGRYSYIRRAIREADQSFQPRMDAAIDRFNRSSPNRFLKRDLRGRFTR